ncbi:MAG: N-6 DNA methylase [Cytophagales bacterium]|nr:N-6 DNA methylase [Cytophagales bacterium]
MAVEKMILEVKTDGNKIYAPLLDKWLVLKPEEKVRQEYICRLVNTYGYSLDQMKQELTVAEGNQRGTGRASADIVVWKSKEEVENEAPIIVVECKAENLTIISDDYWQGFHYARYTNAPFFVTTNLKHTRVFKVNLKFPKTLGEEILDIPEASIVNNSKKVNALLKQTKAFTRDEFSRLLFKCHNIIRNNDKLSPEAAFDEISKILFIKIRYERQNSNSQVFSKKQFKADKEAYERYGSRDSRPFYKQLFENTKEDFKEDDLFAETETIRIRENSFESIVEELEIYNLSTTSDDVKGIAFEKFLGRTFRGELGQFFTPRTVVDFMVEVLDPQEGEIICDPCCGSGGFLIKAFEYVRAKIEKEIHEAKEAIKEEFFTAEYEQMAEIEKEKVDEHVNDLFAKLNVELDIDNEKSRLRVLSYDCIFGTDANPRMSRTAKMNMIMHGDGHGGVHHNDGLLNVNGIFENRFDMILTNPPFGARVEKNLKITEADKYRDADRIKKYKKRYDTPGDPAYTNALRQISDNLNKPLFNLYDTGKMSTLTEVLFIERCINLLKSGGRMGIVLPEGVLNNTNLQRVRDYVESRAKLLFITSIPQDVFVASGATVKPSLLFFKKFTNEEAAAYAAIVQDVTHKVEEEYAPVIAEARKPLTDLEDELEKKNEALKALRKTKKPTKEKVQKLQNDLKEIRQNMRPVKKAFVAREKEIRQEMEKEVKSRVKEQFDYEIPIAEVEKAGISTTGAVIENELEPLAKEFKKYRKRHKLWKSKYERVEYEVVEEDIYRLVANEKQEFYGQ